jgi:hypothetical protein
LKAIPYLATIVVRDYVGASASVFFLSRRKGGATFAAPNPYPPLLLTRRRPLLLTLISGRL